MNLTQIRRALVLDIETASISPTYSDLSDSMQSFWDKKSSRINTSSISVEDYSSEEHYDDKAAIYAEFGRVVCISVGIFEVEDEIKSFRIKSFYGDDEKQILNSFSTLLNDHFYDKYHHTLAGHNLKEFDIPFLCRRMVINEIDLPNLMNIHGAKPWQVPHLLDTLELWKFGDYKNYTSLDLLCEVLGIPSPKNQMDGSMVSAAYWNGQIEDIKTYCEKDVLATARIILRLLGNMNLGDDRVTFVGD